MAVNAFMLVLAPALLVSTPALALADDDVVMIREQQRKEHRYEAKRDAPLPALRDANAEPRNEQTTDREARENARRALRDHD